MRQDWEWGRRIIEGRHYMTLTLTVLHIFLHICIHLYTVNGVFTTCALQKRKQNLLRKENAEEVVMVKMVKKNLSNMVKTWEKHHVVRGCKTLWNNAMFGTAHRDMFQWRVSVTRRGTCTAWAAPDDRPLAAAAAASSLATAMAWGEDSEWRWVRRGEVKKCEEVRDV
jgi:hypothetical protein